MGNKQSIEELTVPGGITKTIGNFIRNIFQSTDDKVVKYASAELGSLINRLAKTKQFKPGQGITLNFLRNTKEYKNSLMTLGENTAQKLYKKSFNQLTNIEKKEVLKQTTTNLDEVLKNQLKLTGKSISDDLAKGTIKGTKLATAQRRLASIQRELQILEKGQTKKTVNAIIKNNLKLIGDAKSGVKILDKIKSNQITIVKNGQFYKITKDSAKNRPIKLLQINRDAIKKIGIYGASAATIIYLIATMYPNDEVAVVDENGNDIDAGSGENSKGGGLKYKNCTDFPFAFGCINPKIAEMQQKLGIKPAKGYFGPITRRALGGTNTITLDMYNNTMNSGASSGPNLKASDMPGYKKEFTPPNKVNVQAPSYLNYNELAQQPENPNTTYRASI